MEHLNLTKTGGIPAKAVAPNKRWIPANAIAAAKNVGKISCPQRKTYEMWFGKIKIWQDLGFPNAIADSKNKNWAFFLEFRPDELSLRDKFGRKNFRKMLDNSTKRMINIFPSPPWTECENFVEQKP